MGFFGKDKIVDPYNTMGTPAQWIDGKRVQKILDADDETRKALKKHGYDSREYSDASQRLRNAVNSASKTEVTAARIRNESGLDWPKWR